MLLFSDPQKKVDEKGLLQNGSKRTKRKTSDEEAKMGKRQKDKAKKKTKIVIPVDEV